MDRLESHPIRYCASATTAVHPATSSEQITTILDAAATAAPVHKILREHNISSVWFILFSVYVGQTCGTDAALNVLFVSYTHNSFSTKNITGISSAFS
jgi:hypothetical protein